jgi:putative restriction endonuclease
VATLDKTQLLERLRGAIVADGWWMVSDGEHPFDVTVMRGEVSLGARLYIWNVTHGGGRKRPALEQRIQITGVPVPLAANAGDATAILGWHEGYGVVAAFDPVHHNNPSPKSPSVQISEEALAQAAATGFAVHHRGQHDIAVAFRPEWLPYYIEHQHAIHQMAMSPEELSALRRAAVGDASIAEYLASAAENQPSSATALMERAVVLRTVATSVRAWDFSRRVVTAYSGACAMCGLQLGLTDAAHIVPVAAPLGTDATSNGLALCPTHHRAYDRGLIAVNPDYSVLLNAERVATLQAQGRGQGDDELMRAVGDELIVPTDRADQPDPALLSEGLRLRGWT